ncbi:MAG: hypothetical protein OEY49_10950 [Candidatus Heimdallarchaeota archaeon]|nr:hypothetical protein [Candidatus Heimdallarchaeota archaeon]
MIEEVRIITKSGINVFSGQINLNSAEIKVSDTDVLFAGFISAILSVSEELQNADIRQIGYYSKKIVFTPTKNLVFLGFSSAKVPDKDVELLLEKIVEKWMVKFNDEEYVMVSNEMGEDIIKIIEEAMEEVFWFTHPNYNSENNLKLIKSLFSNPGGSYFVRYLPNKFLLTAGLFFMIPLFLAFILGTYITGFSSNWTNLFDVKSIINTTIVMILMVAGPPIIMKLLFKEKFNLQAYLILTGIYSIILSLMVISTSAVWLALVFQPLLNLVTINIIQFFIVIFLLFAPINIGFFGFLILSAYGGSFVSEVESKKYYLSYLIGLLLMISMSEIIFGNLSELIQ